MRDHRLILPPLQRTTADAEAFARIVHEGQFDKAGRPYVEHLAGVAHRAAAKISGMPGILSPTIASEVVQIAWLHDVVEDTRHTADDLRMEGFSDVVADGVFALTKPLGNGAYLDWINDLASTASLLIVLVKIADIEDNSDPERLALLNDATRERLSAKYGAALPILKDAAARLGWKKR
ncbi:metal-dependent phosphohydrolase [Methylobacterium sp. WL69]|nr:metal-dependent phosphohydrolase [Methylobacterium sp. WL69]